MFIYLNLKQTKQKIMKRFDYRRRFKEMDKEQLKKQLELHKNIMLDYLSSNMDADYYLKRVSYIEKILKKIK
jgi:hypothetical protein